MTPGAPQWASFEKDGGAYSGAVLQGVFLNMTDEAAFHAGEAFNKVGGRNWPGTGAGDCSSLAPLDGMLDQFGRVLEVELLLYMSAV
jgi:hypothetical protein